MTREERLEVAFKIAGIGFIALALSSADAVRSLLGTVWGLVHEGSLYDLRGRLTIAGFLFAHALATFLAGVVLTRLAQPLSERFRPPEAEAPALGSEQFLPFAVLLLGVTLLLPLLLAVPFALLRPSNVSFGGGILIVPVGFAGFILIAGARPLAKLLRRGMRLPQSEAGLGVPGLALGVLVVGMHFCVYEPWTILGALTTTVPAVAAPDGALADLRFWRYETLVTSSVRLALGLGLVCYAGRVAMRLSCRSMEAEAEAPPSGGFSADMWLALAVFVAVVYIALRYVTYCIHAPFLTLFHVEWLATAETWAYHLVLPVGSAVAILCVAGRQAWKVGRRLCPEPFWQREPGSDATAVGQMARVYSEVAVTVIALFFAIGLLSQAFGRHFVAIAPADGSGVASSFSSYAPEHVIAAAAAIVALLLRGEIARLFWRHHGSDAHVPASRRAAALRPWLVLMGLWYVLSTGPDVVYWFGARSGREPCPWAALLKAVPGLVLLLAAPWVARRLSYGPLIPAIRSAIGRRLNYGRD
jgi:hypothetical protein